MRPRRSSRTAFPTPRHRRAAWRVIPSAPGAGHVAQSGALGNGIVASSTDERVNNRSWLGRLRSRLGAAPQLTRVAPPPISRPSLRPCLLRRFSLKKRRISRCLGEDRCRRFEVPAPPAEGSFRNFKSTSGTKVGCFPVPLCFRSSCEGVPRGCNELRKRGTGRSVRDGTRRDERDGASPTDGSSPTAMGLERIFA
jgi:hypothetical protein